MNDVSVVLLALVATVSSACGDAVAQTAPRDGFEAEWKWVQAEFPEAAVYHPLTSHGTPLLSLLSWAKPGETITLYDRACRGFSVTRQEDFFSGLIHQQTVVRGRTKTVSALEIELGERITIHCGVSDSYERTKSGEWVKTASTGGGCARGVGQLLSRVNEEAAWYGNTVARLSAGCVKSLDEEMTCNDGKSRRCRRCAGWGLLPTSMEPRVGMGRHVPTLTRKVEGTVDCREPCPTSQPPEKVRRANAILQGHSFLVGGAEEHPFVFRTRDACHRYRRQHPIASEHLKPW